MQNLFAAIPTKLAKLFLSLATMVINMIVDCIRQIIKRVVFGVRGVHRMVLMLNAATNHVCQAAIIAIASWLKRFIQRLLPQLIGCYLYVAVQRVIDPE